ncbi:ATP-binding protein [Povalibacter sp.]|uniref:ATP-binding protein n=1 Tax=Povalibacter sp. TaxID=1962978 RepID=UPI002F3F0719
MLFPLQREPQSAFLLSLEDAIRPLADPADITATAAAALGRYLAVNGCAYADVEDDQDTFNLTGNFSDGVVSIVGRYTFSAFGEECLRLMRAGEPYVVSDSGTDPRAAEVRELYRRTEIRAVICVPLHKASRFVAAVAVHQSQPRQWQEFEIALVEQVASRCWESIERTRLHRQLQALNADLEQQVQRRTDELVQSERQLAQLINGISDCAIFLLSPSGRVGSWNPGAARIKGYSAEEIIGRHFSVFYSAEDRAQQMPQRALEIARTTGKFEGEGWRVRKDGSTFWAVVLIDAIRAPDGTLTGFAKITRDMTERRVMQEQLNQSQKMEAIGQLTGGVAHDFNNMLTVILGNLDTIYRRVPRDDERLHRAIDNATQGAERAAALTHQLLAFARRQPLHPKSTDVNRLISGLLDLIRRTLPENITVESTLMPEVGWVQVDPNQLENALINLVVNARDAIEGPGALTIQTVSIEMEARLGMALGQLPAGPYVVICVSDTGRGMAPEVVARAFEPFYTTKPPGQGTGLGLSQVFGFVRQSGGRVRLYSEVGQGTTVKIYLPRSDVRPPAAKVAHEEGWVQAAPDELVLVVEDEDDVREYTVDCLEELGFTVLQARDSDAALSLLRAEPGIRLLFTDVGLPGRNGRQLANEAWVLRPRLPVLFTTGYARDAVFHHGADHMADLLTKPFTRAQLASRVRPLLDRARAEVWGRPD